MWPKVTLQTCDPRLAPAVQVPGFLDRRQRQRSSLHGKNIVLRLPAPQLDIGFRATSAPTSLSRSPPMPTCTSPHPLAYPRQHLPSHTQRALAALTHPVASTTSPDAHDYAHSKARVRRDTRQAEQEEVIITTRWDQMEMGELCAGGCGAGARDIRPVYVWYYGALLRRMTYGFGHRDSGAPVARQ
ncbi:hypothetical protein B0H17DRAFT_1139854 [Mycena rosella]|uniref:Uncharacterized protein n=1 Tax=Mycena rosella TaxID=1033263 RepID=A0AAD7D348_MYCRO|nr:hypothetical protein B0H17DRAFT_1139854 [Mycena rosella]